MNNFKNKLNLTITGLNVVKETKVNRNKQINTYIRAIFKIKQWVQIKKQQQKFKWWT